MWRSMPGSEVSSTCKSREVEGRWARPPEGATGGEGRVQVRSPMGFVQRLLEHWEGKPGVFREVTPAASMEDGQGREGWGR